MLIRAAAGIALVAQVTQGLPEQRLRQQLLQALVTEVSRGLAAVVPPAPVAVSELANMRLVVLV